MAKKIKDADVIAENQRSRNWCMVLYEDDETHVKALELLNKGYMFVAIKHDQDVTEDGELKKPHYHVVLKFPQARWRTAIAKDLGIADNYLQICRSLAASYCYLTHMGLPNSFQYPHDAMFGPLYAEATKAMERERDQNEKVLSLLALISSEGFTNEWKVLEKACQNGLVGDALRLGGLLSRLIEIHNTDLAAAPLNAVFSRQIDNELDDMPVEQLSI